MRTIYGLAVIPYMARRATCAVLGHRRLPGLSCTRCGEPSPMIVLLQRMVKQFGLVATSAQRAGESFAGAMSDHYTHHNPVEVARRLADIKDRSG